MSSQKINRLERIAKEFRKMEKGTLVELTIRAGKLHHTTAGYLEKIEIKRGRGYVVLNRYKQESDDFFEVISNTRYPLKIVKGYTAYK